VTVICFLTGKKEQENDRKIPAGGVQNFEQMIKGNFLYVDKTRYIYNRPLSKVTVDIKQELM